MSDDSESIHFDLLTITGVAEAGRCKRCRMPFAIGDDLVMRVTDREQENERAGIVLKINLIHDRCPNPDGHDLTTS